MVHHWTFPPIRSVEIKKVIFFYVLITRTDIYTDISLCHMYWVSNALKSLLNYLYYLFFIFIYYFGMGKAGLELSPLSQTRRLLLWYNLLTTCWKIDEQDLVNNKWRYCQPFLVNQPFSGFSVFSLSPVKLFHTGQCEYRRHLRGFFLKIETHFLLLSVLCSATKSPSPSLCRKQTRTVLSHTWMRQRKRNEKKEYAGVCESLCV